VVRASLSVLLIALIALMAGPAHSADMVTIMLSESGGAYGEVAVALRAELPAGVLVRETLDAPAQDASGKPQLLIAIGAKSCGTAARSASGPLLCALIPKATFERITGDPASHNRTITAVFLDQPPSRQMALIRLLLPKAETVAMLVGPESAPSESVLTTAAKRHGLGVAVARAPAADDLYPALQRLLDGSSDALLAVPDVRVFNSGTVQNILRVSIRARVPLFAFSPAYVRAGALAAVYSTPQQAGRQAGLLARELLGGRPLPAPLYPAEFTVTVNPQVARSLGIDVADGETLTGKLRAQEKLP
jgi:putative ABC transport system substrate-binding protein